MLRFFDREVVCISIEGLKRQELLSWFFKNGLDEIICVSDENGLFAGYITYYSLIVCENANDALIKDCLVLNENIWENARAYAKLHKRRGIPGEVDQLPVVNEEGYLISFAWYDMDANRELRQLRELSECAEACRFRDIFPQYDRVYIHEFNELAFFFAKYLAWQGIPVIVEGALWEGFFESAAEEGLDYRTLHIYAEGVAPKEQNWIENILRSASVEFECVDTIYEKNIKAGIINDADGTEEDLLRKLKSAEAIVIEGTGTEALDAYDYLLGRGLDILCFVSGNVKGKSQTLFGKRVLSAHDVYTSGKDAAWIIPSGRGSAWQGLDLLEYIGYKRNERCFMLRDYVEPESEGLSNVLKGHRIICVGEMLLCRKLIQLLEKNAELGCTFEYKETEKLGDGINEKDFILCVAPCGIEISGDVCMNELRRKTQQAIEDTLHSEEELRRLCELWDIEWSDCLMEPTRYGKKQYDNGSLKKGFDLEPVYNNYEVCFSELDRMKITLFCSSWQRKSDIHI